MATNACCRFFGISSIVTARRLEPDATNVAVWLPFASKTVDKKPVGVATISSIVGAEAMIPRMTPTPEQAPITMTANTHTSSDLQKIT